MLRLPSAALWRRTLPSQTQLGLDLTLAHHDECESSIRRVCSNSGASLYRELSSVVDIERNHLLGTGGFGTVHLGRLRGSGHPCAVKTLRKDDSWARDLALRESEILGSLSHPGICQLLEVIEDEDNIYLVLEYIDGCELLDDILEQKRMSECRAAEIMRQVIEALSYCHGLDRAVVHRDLKPENIMLKSTGLGVEVKLIDFGLASFSGQQLSGTVGTIPYLAPEAGAAKGTCNPALDMWSVGVILHTLLVGELPSMAVRTGSVPLDATGKRWQGISSSARELLSGLLCASPQNRLTVEEAAAHPWLNGIPSPPKQVDELVAGCTTLLTWCGCSTIHSENSTRASTCAQDSDGDCYSCIGANSGAEREQLEEVGCEWR